MSDFEYYEDLMGASPDQEIELGKKTHPTLKEYLGRTEFPVELFSEDEMDDWY